MSWLLVLHLPRLCEQVKHSMRSSPAVPNLHSELQQDIAKLNQRVMVIIVHQSFPEKISK